VTAFTDMRRDMTTSFDEHGIRQAITFYAEGIRCAKAIITVW